MGEMCIRDSPHPFHLLHHLQDHEVSTGFQNVLSGRLDHLIQRMHLHLSLIHILSSFVNKSKYYYPLLCLLSGLFNSFLPIIRKQIVVVVPAKISAIPSAQNTPFTPLFVTAGII